MTQQADDLKGLYFPVLDHGFVALKSYMGGDEDIEESARVSYGKGTRKTSETRGLLRYLLSHNHTTPFEMVVLKYHISMPLHVHRQFIRHRMSSTNEYSARYSVVPERYYTIAKENCGYQSKSNKQGRAEPIPDDLYNEFTGETLDLQKRSFALYNKMADAGVAREVARMHLPLNTYTYFYWKCDLHNLFHLLKLRLDSHAQLEIRQYAGIMAGIAQAVAPLAFEAFLDYKLEGRNFSAAERRVLNQLIYIGDNNASPEEIDGVMEYEGLASREKAEFLSKLQAPENHNFTLRVEDAKDYSYFENQMNEVKQ